MAHLTSQWADRYGLADPAVPAELVRGASEGILRACYARFAAASLAAEIGGARARDATRALSEGWSTPQAEQATIGLGAASDRLEGLCRDMARDVAALAAAVAGARDEVDRAYVHADSTIAAERLNAEPLVTTLEDSMLLVQRRAGLVAETHVATSSALRKLDDEASAVIDRLAADPRDLLPRGVTADLAVPATGSAVASAARTDAASRAALAADLRSPDPRRAHFALAVQHALDATTGGAQLVTYDPDADTGQGAAAIAVGDIARADAVSILVPGVSNSPMDMSGTMRLATDLAAATSRAGAAGTRSAAIVWFGYDIPLSWTGDRPPARGHDPLAAILGDSALALDATAALPAAAGLSAFARTARAMMPPSAGLTLIGHSYGSTVVSQAARTLDGDAGVDDIVLLGSPGAGYRLQSADDYTAVPPEHVYTLAFPADPIANGVTDVVASLINPFGTLVRGLVLGDKSGPFGVDPNAARFGAQAITAPSGTSWNGGIDLTQHALENYLSGPALDAVAAVTAGRYSAVPVRGGG